MGKELKILVSNIQRFSIHDGPGIRTTLFFKGCPLSCRWCHNPETISYHNELMFIASKCMGCGDCAAACPESAIVVTNGGPRTDYTRCKACFRCAEACPGGARAPVARAFDADDLLAEALRDLDFYGDDGGITLSGGEPLAHAGFHQEFLAKAKAAGLNIAAETCGLWSYESNRAFLDLIDLFLFDVKVVDEERHRACTGQSNKLILENLKKLIRDGHDVHVRMPFVPGFNTDKDNLRRTAELLCALGLAEITLLPYHALGESKLSGINSQAAPLGINTPDESEISAAADFFESYGIRYLKS